MVPFIMQNERELEVLKERTRLALPFMSATCALEGSPPGSRSLTQGCHVSSRAGG
jgi:hypothetical protein